MAKKIINSAEKVCAEMMDGFVGAYGRYYRRVAGTNSLMSTAPRRDKVALVVGGGSGHEPLFGGFVGKGLGDAAACGNIFASPDPGTVVAVAQAVESGRGVLFVYGNYAGDNMNFDMAEEMLQDEGMQTAHVRVWDDCASAPRERIEDRRGIAGDVFVIKIAGAACDAGLSLAEAARVTGKARDSLCSIGVATAPGTIPGLAAPTFQLGADEMEYGMGLHGEPGIRRIKMKPADELVTDLYDTLTADFPVAPGDEVCVLINGLGSTTLLEMSIVYRRVAQLLERDGVKVYDADIGSFCTCQEMGGFSISLLKLDEELKRYYDAPCYSPFYAKEGK